MNYKKSYRQRDGFTPLCTAGESSLKQLEFGIIELHAGQSCGFSTGEREAAFVILGGIADFQFDDTVWKNVGGRRSVFEGKAHSVYIPRHKDVAISTPWSVKIAVCTAPVTEDTIPEIIGPDRVRTMKLGQKPWERDTHFLIDAATNAKRLTIGEAFITPGNWAGFPPHKHEADAMPQEAVLDELYYFLFQPKQGFGIQCMYTGDGRIDECYRVKSDDLVEFPEGYHTTVAAPGYNSYFLWAMAGEHQGFYRSNDPDHDWVSALENVLKKM